MLNYCRYMVQPSINFHQCMISLYETYYVPTTLLVVLSSVLFEVKIFARPKSEILGFISPSKRMLLGLRSRCMTRNRECLCRQRSPCAIPSIIAIRLFQFSKALLFSSANRLIYFSYIGTGFMALTETIVRVSFSPFDASTKIMSMIN